MKHKITRPKAKKFTSVEIVDRIVIILIAIIILAAVILLGIIIGFAHISAIIPAVLFLCGATALLALSMYKSRQKRKDLDEYQSELMDSISDEELEKINSQLTKDNYYYKTFYLTEKYICFPKAAVKLIPYDRIENVSAGYKHYSRYEKGMFMFVTLKDDRTLRFLINETLKFSKKKDAFLIEFKEILRNGSKMKRKDR
ncbi:MAG: hypothetical protein J1F11_04985 [Oscillospiraceae bacterium]|nr:hypothetical protein [Oscillospiraceae bacterium]